MKINLINMPICNGNSLKGANFAFSKLLENSLEAIISKNHLINEIIDIEVYEDIDSKEDRPKNLKSVSKANIRLSNAIYKSFLNDCFPFTIGGDHSLAIGSINGVSRYFKKFAVVYVDAHGDFNTIDTSLSQNIHGMPLASAMKFKNSPLSEIFQNPLKPKDLYHIGARDLDAKEIDLAKEYNLTLYTNEVIKETGLTYVLDQVISNLVKNNYDGVHLSFDIDVLDTTLVPGTGYSLADGLQVADVEYIFDRLFETKLITSMDFVEFNPLLDNKEETTLKNVLHLIQYISKKL